MTKNDYENAVQCLEEYRDKTLILRAKRQRHYNNLLNKYIELAEMLEKADIEVKECSDVLVDVEDSIAMLSEELSWLK